MFSITKNGEPLNKSLYTRDEKTKTLYTNEIWLVLDFRDYSDCTFKTGYDCTFKTGYGCTFKTGSDCTFDTGSDCTFDTGYDCTFKTGYGCTFKTRSDCTFDTRSDCTFDTGSDCTFDTGYDCTFDTGYGCTFKTGSDCVVVRRDVFEVIVLKEEKNHIKLNWYNIPWYTNILEEEIEEYSEQHKMCDICQNKEATRFFCEWCYEDIFNY